MARTETQKMGSIPLHTLDADVDYAQATARTTYGAIGIKVWIYKGKFGEELLVPDRERRRPSRRMGDRGGRPGDRPRGRGEAKTGDRGAGPVAPAGPTQEGQS
jgi:small subunit ribosomal protein S3